MTYSEPVRNQKPNRLGTGNRTEPNRFLNYIPRNRTEPNREPEIHQFLETETEPNRSHPDIMANIVLPSLTQPSFICQNPPYPTPLPLPASLIPLPPIPTPNEAIPGLLVVHLSLRLRLGHQLPQRLLRLLRGLHVLRSLRGAQGGL